MSDTKKWYLIDAKDKTVGRISILIAKLISGKHKATYISHLNSGDSVIVINVEKVQITGKKFTKKKYRRHSGRPGGLKTETFEQLRRRISERILEESVMGMLPKGSLGYALIRNLKVYTGQFHPHTSQKPIVLDKKNYGNKR